MAENTVPGMAVAIASRMEEERLTPTTFAAKAGLTTQGLDPVRGGTRRNYQAKTTLGVARALRWPADWYQRLLNGNDPVTFPTVSWPDERSSEERLTAVETEVAGLRADLQRLVDGAGPPASGSR